MKSAVIVFPGSNCDRDVAVTLEAVTGKKPAMVWHGETSVPSVDLIVLPGGFSYGDYLRSGAMAAHSPILRAVSAEAKRGVAVLGICNGFQILTEAGLLPGALCANEYECCRCDTDQTIMDLCRPVHPVFVARGLDTKTVRSVAERIARLRPSENVSETGETAATTDKPATLAPGLDPERGGEE